jgi:hypothetical protein
MGGVYYLLADSVGFDNLMHGKGMKKDSKQRSLEDFGMFLTLSLHELITNLISRIVTTCLYTTRKECIDCQRMIPNAKQLITGGG